MWSAVSSYFANHCHALQFGGSFTEEVCLVQARSQSNDYGVEGLGASPPHMERLVISLLFLMQCLWSSKSVILNRGYCLLFKQETFGYIWRHF